MKLFAPFAPEWVQRIVTPGCETGLRPAELVHLHRTQFEKTPQGRHIRIRTKSASAPPIQTPAMAALIDATPTDRMLILISDRGRPMRAATPRAACATGGRRRG